MLLSDIKPFPSAQIETSPLPQSGMFFPPPIKGRLPKLPFENMEEVGLERLSWITGYDIEIHEWVTLEGLDCDASAYDHDAWSKLVMDQQTKDLIQSILDTIGCSFGGQQPEHVRQGNILLKGALGTGKNTVARAICNMLKCPMFDIWVNDIPSLADVQRWAAKIASWNAVVVVDRRDYFMKSKSPVNQPLIVIFGAIYFGMAYVMYKYKLLFVFYKPYEYQGQAWPLTSVRLIWGIIILQTFMIGILTLRKCYIIPSLLVPLLAGSAIWSWYIHETFKPLSTASQPPMANQHNGVLNIGKRRYGHPALNGVLSEPWLPLNKGQTLDGSPPDAGPSNPWVDMRTARGSQPHSNLNHRLSFDPASGVIMLPEDGDWLMGDDSDNDYGTMSPTPEGVHSPNNASQEILLPTNGQSPSTPLASPSKRRHGKYYHHPERRRTIPGSFPLPT
ncbi:hypothetical protein P692DRAFT_20880156 [Suillus brevipes Sb2]|nr:hypothetical protein P692DRAFT_20880156 [Suillus brevipes Sb2]